MGLVSAYGAARDADEQWERTKPRGMWGVGLNGEEDAPPEDPNIDPRYAHDPNSFAPPRNSNMANQQQSTPRSGLIGNAALDAQRMLDPNLRNPLSRNYDPALARINRGVTHG